MEKIVLAKSAGFCYGVARAVKLAEDLAERIRAFNRMNLAELKENARSFYETRLRPEDNYRMLMEIYEDISK